MIEYLAKIKKINLLHFIYINFNKKFKNKELELASVLGKKCKVRLLRKFSILDKNGISKTKKFKFKTIVMITVIQSTNILYYK